MEKKLPCKTIYSLSEASKILKKYFDREEIDERYLVDLAHQGYFRLHTKILLDQFYYAIPMQFSSNEYLIDEIELKFPNEKTLMLETRNKKDEIKISHRLLSIFGGLGEYEICQETYGEISHYDLYKILNSEKDELINVSIVDIYDQLFDEFLEIQSICGESCINLYEIDEDTSIDLLFTKAMITENFTIQPLEIDEVKNWQFMEIEKLKAILSEENKKIEEIIKRMELQPDINGQIYYWYSNYGDNRKSKEISVNLDNLYIHKIFFEKILSGDLEINQKILDIRRENLSFFKEKKLLEAQDVNKLRGKSKAKEDAQFAARTLANYLWKQDINKKIKIKEMAVNVFAELNQTEHHNQLPDQAISLKKWIEDIAPDYAREAGRQKEI